jgi:Na+/H+-dicarboxylate symporter
MFDIIGYIALGLNLYSMYSKGEYRLRVFSAIANFAYVIYGVLINALPLVIGCTIAVILHLYRLHKLKQEKISL